MKRTLCLTLTAAAFVILPAAHALAQTAGTSHPELLSDDLSTAPATAHYAKPSPKVAGEAATAPAVAVQAPSLQVHAVVSAAPSDDHYVPYRPASAMSLPEPTPTKPADRSTIVTDDINSGIVATVHASPNQLTPGTILKAALEQNISTQATVAGTAFTAALVADIGHDGRVLLPTGAVLHGRITQVRGGRRIGGNAAIHLQPDYIVLPDGTSYRLNAEVIDLDHFKDSRVNGEGTIVAAGHPKATAAALGLTTASAVVAGAILGGGVGAVVGLGVGAGVGAIWWLKHDRQEALPKGTEIAFSLDESLFVGMAQ